MRDNLSYIGTELEVFSHAKNWKSYWAKAIFPYLGKSVIDVGAGIGATARTLNIKNYEKWVELEPDKNLCEQIAAAISVGDIPKYFEIVNGVSTDLAQREVFDTALYIDVLEHIENDAAELQNIGQVIKPGGHIIILSPAHNFLYSEFDQKIGHYRRYSKNNLESLTPSGFKIEKLCYLDSVGLLASLANKLFLKSGSPAVSQIIFWDRFMVPISRLIDPILLHRVGKSVLYVIKKNI